VPKSFVGAGDPDFGNKVVQFLSHREKIAVNAKTMRLCSLVLMATLAPLMAKAQTEVKWAGNGHYYDVIVGAKNWADANAAASSHELAGVPATLVSITSQGENDFVIQLLNSRGVSRAWTGGSTADADPEAGIYGHWVTGEPIPDNNSAGSYANWHNGEPNPAEGPAAIAVPRQGSTDQWDSRDSTETQEAYIIEYEGIVDATTCPDGCPIYKNHKLISSFTPAAGSLIGVIPTLLSEAVPGFEEMEALRCSNGQQLIVYGAGPDGVHDGALHVLSDGADDGNEIVVSPRHCGYPDIRIIETKFSIINPDPDGLWTGVLEPETDVNPLTECDEPLISSDTTNQALFVVQPTDKDESIEYVVGPSLSSNSGLAGAAQDFSDHCGNSVWGQRGGGTYTLDGLTFHDDALSSGSVLDNYGIEATYRLQLLQVLVDEAKNAGAIRNGDWKKLTQMLLKGIETVPKYDDLYKQMLNLQKFNDTQVTYLLTGYKVPIKVRIDAVTFLSEKMLEIFELQELGM
jgi:hypothetical protein